MNYILKRSWKPTDSVSNILKPRTTNQQSTWWFKKKGGGSEEGWKDKDTRKVCMVGK